MLMGASHSHMARCVDARGFRPSVCFSLLMEASSLWLLSTHLSSTCLFFQGVADVLMLSSLWTLAGL
ncbi:hypothetical protein Mapa_001262 [Marchantia paleacea]|nr:hypothetical protein Mapa_001262 [Marchantia paleacea]